MDQGHWKGFPDSLRVGAHDYEAYFVFSEGMTTGDRVALGEFGSLEQTFRFNKDVASRSGAADTALHEIFHALLEPLGLDPEEEERICYTLGGGVVQVLRDNPSFKKWLTGLK